MLSSDTEEYDFVESLGHGMFAEVARFQRRSDQKMVAVKRIPRVHMRICIQQARPLAALTVENAFDHHNVRFYQAFWTVFRQVVTALAKLKDMGIVHADIKQENIKRHQPLRVKLVDFGSAKTAHDLASMWMPYIQPRFDRAPGVLLVYPCTAKINMWSLACVMGEMALGRTLFPSRCELELAHSIFGSRGLPSATMLEKSIKAKMFCDMVDNGREAYEWRLKPSQRRELFTGTQSLRGHVPANLELLQALEDLEKGSEEQEFAESADRKQAAVSGPWSLWS